MNGGGVEGRAPASTSRAQCSRSSAIAETHPRALATLRSSRVPARCASAVARTRASVLSISESDIANPPPEDLSAAAELSADSAAAFFFPKDARSKPATAKDSALSVSGSASRPTIFAERAAASSVSRAFAAFSAAVVSFSRRNSAASSGGGGGSHATIRVSASVFAAASAASRSATARSSAARRWATASNASSASFASCGDGAGGPRSSRAVHSTASDAIASAFSSFFIRASTFSPLGPELAYDDIARAAASFTPTWSLSFARFARRSNPPALMSFLRASASRTSADDIASAATLRRFSASSDPSEPRLDPAHADASVSNPGSTARYASLALLSTNKTPSAPTAASKSLSLASARNASSGARVAAFFAAATSPTIAIGGASGSGFVSAGSLPASRPARALATHARLQATRQAYSRPSSECAPPEVSSDASADATRSYAAGVNDSAANSLAFVAISHIPLSAASRSSASSVASATSSLATSAAIVLARLAAGATGWSRDAAAHATSSSRSIARGGHRAACGATPDSATLASWSSG